MKFKTFILTFIMIMSSPFLFGHQNISNYDWDNVASLQDNAKMSTQFQSDDNTRSGNEIVAKIGEDGYATLQGAVDAAQSGDVIQLVSNVTLTETLNISAGKNVTLDLSGKTISQTKEQTAGYQMILNDGNLTIEDSSNEKTGKISYTDSGNGGEYISDVIYNRSVLVINGGTIENISSATVASNGYPHAVDTYSGIRNTSVTINGGTIHCVEYSAVRMFCVSAIYNADLVINGGTIKGAIDMQNGTKNSANGTLTINGGTFETTKNENNIRFANWNGGATEYGITAGIEGGLFDGGITTQYVPAAANWDKKIIRGGTFAQNMSEYCSEGYEIVENADGTYGVVQEDAVAQIVGGQGYATLQDAIDAATEGQTIVMISNVELTATVVVATDKNVNLDLNGKVISGVSETAGASAVIENKGILKVLSSVEGGKITSKSLYPDVNWGGEGEPPFPTYANNTINNRGTLTLESGTIENTNVSGGATYAIDCYTGSTTNINGGIVLNENNCAIRMFANGDMTVNVTEGEIIGTRAIWLQLPSADPSLNPDVNINIEGGVLTSNETVYNLAIYLYSYGQSAENVNIIIEDGIFNGDIAIYEPTITMKANSVQIMGGTFNGNYGIYTYYNPDDISIISITGGTFTKETAVEYVNWYAYDDGYICVENADGTYGVVQQGTVAQIVGGQSYQSLQDAINAVEDNQTIKLLCDNNENIVAGNENQKPFNKIFTIDGNNFNVTGKWHFGRDDHNQDNSEITVINTNFSVNGIKINDFKSVTIDECTFKNITEGNGIYVAADEFTSSIVVTNCEIENVAGAGINFRNPVNATITGNTIKNTGNNAITFQHGTYQEAETGTYTIKNNVFENWANNATEGRAIRIAVGEAQRFMIIEENAMIKTNAPEEFVKITGNTDNVSIDENYWNGANPIDEHTPAYYLIEGVTPNDYYQDYSVENGLQNLLPTQTPVAQIVGGQSYTTLHDAINAVEYGQTIVMIDDTELETNITISSDKVFYLNLNGKKITYTSTTQNEAMITNKGNLTIMNEVNDKDEMGEICYNYVGPADNTHGKGNYTISNAGILAVNGGKIHIAELSRHAKYPIDNNSTSGDAILEINGGHLYNYNTCAIRQFCNSTTYQNSVTINGGLIEGYGAIWMQNPGKNEVNGQLIINNGEIRTTAKAYVEGTSPISEVSSAIYCTIDGEGGSWDAESEVKIIGGTINENVYLNNETPASITLYKEADYNGYVEFELAEGIELHHNGLENATITKTIEGTNEDGWYTIASPVGTVGHSAVEGLLTNNTHDLYRYDEPTQMWQNVKVAENNFTTLDAGRGYIYANTAPTTLSFTGDLVAESVQQEISASGSELKGFNLIGNPFTHNIKLENISGAVLAEGFYTLTKEGAWNAKTDNDAIICAGQGALIKTIETKTVQINPTAASKSRGVNNGQLKIKVANSKYNDVAYVSFNKGIGLDKINHRNADIPMVFVPVNGTNYAVAVMSNDVTEIPVSFVAKTMGEYTIGVEAQDCEFAQMTLIDKMTGYSTNLLLEDYTFIATSKDNADRFIIRLMSSFDHSFGVDNFVIFNNNEMIINDIQGEGVIRIVDVLGRPVAEYNVFGSANISTTSFRSGVYMIQVIDDNGVKVQKIIID